MAIQFYGTASPWKVRLATAGRAQPLLEAGALDSTQRALSLVGQPDSSEKRVFGSASIRGEKTGGRAGLVLLSSRNGYNRNSDGWTLNEASAQMKSPPKVGTTFEQRFRVEPQHTVHFSEQGVPPVLATPWLIWLLESAALESLKPFLDADEMSVGVQVEMEHLAPTPLGAEVVCVARVVHSEGPVVSFQIDARDAHEPIARGLHKRRVVNSERFIQLVQKKAI